MTATYSEATLRADIKSVMAAVSGIGIVHDYERFADDWDTLVQFFVDAEGEAGTLKGWTISLASMDKDHESFGGPGAAGTVLVTYNYLIRGFMALSDTDETEKTFTTLAISLMAALDADVTLHSAARNAGASGYFFGPPIKGIRWDHRMFGDVLVHYCEIDVVEMEVV